MRSARSLGGLLMTRLPASSGAAYALMQRLAITAFLTAFIRMFSVYERKLAHYAGAYYFGIYQPVGHVRRC